jgi:hypothetical protein
MTLVPVSSTTFIRFVHCTEPISCHGAEQPLVRSMGGGDVDGIESRAIYIIGKRGGIQVAGCALI